MQPGYTRRGGSQQRGAAAYGLASAAERTIIILHPEPAMRRATPILILALLSLATIPAAARDAEKTQDETMAAGVTTLANPRLNLVNWANRNLERAALEIGPEDPRRTSATTSLAIRSLSDSLRRQLRSASLASMTPTEPLRPDEGFLRIRSAGLDEGVLTARQIATLTGRRSAVLEPLGVPEAAADPSPALDPQRIPLALSGLLILGAVALLILLKRQLGDWSDEL